MKRHLLVLALAGLFGALVSVDAQACCHKKQAACTPACEPAPPPPPPVCEPAPACAPAPKHCGLFKHNAGCGHKKMFAGGGLCHKKAECAPAPVACEAPMYAPTYAPVYAAPQATPQATAQGS